MDFLVAGKTEPVIIPKEVIFDLFDGDKSVHSAKRGAKRDTAVSGKCCNDADGRI